MNTNILLLNRLARFPTELSQKAEGGYSYLGLAYMPTVFPVAEIETDDGVRFVQLFKEEKPNCLTYIRKDLFIASYRRLP